MAITSSSSPFCAGTPPDGRGLWQEYHSIADKIEAGLTSPGDYGDEIASLSSKLSVEYDRLNSRLDEMAKVFLEAASSLRSAVRFAR